MLLTWLLLREESADIENILYIYTSSNYLLGNMLISYDSLVTHLHYQNCRAVSTSAQAFDRFKSCQGGTNGPGTILLGRLKNHGTVPTGARARGTIETLMMNGDMKKMHKNHMSMKR